MKKILINNFKKHNLFIILTVIYFLFAFLTYKDFGATFDERVEYSAGSYLLKYFQTPYNITTVSEMLNNKPDTIEMRHMPMFSSYSRVYIAAASFLNPKMYFEQFHLINLLAGYLLLLFSYALFILAGKSPKISLIAPLAIILNPYIFGHIAANPKDIPFAWIYLIGLVIIYWANVKKPTGNIQTLLLGAAFGLAISMRTVGVSLVLIHILFSIYLTRKINKDLVVNNILIGVVACFFWIITLPFLGANFFGNSLQLFANSAFFNDWKGTVFYLGQYLGREQRPWHYLFVLMFFKLPLVTLLAFIFGLISNVKALVKENALVKRNKISDLQILLLFTIVFNFALYLITKPVIYNVVRHFLYLLVPITLYAAFYIAEFIEKYNSKNFRNRFIMGGIFAYALFTFLRMILLHPYEYIYYNELVGGLRGADKMFELDYWGASYKEATQKIRVILKEKKLRNAKVFTCDNSFVVAYYSQFEFSLVGRPKDADYIICDTFRDRIRELAPKYKEIDFIKREGVIINVIREGALVTTSNR